jgi:hypothetical protein
MLLLFGGAIYMQTISNASQIDNRNLRELSRIGQGIEGRVNNLQTVIRNLAREKDFTDRNKTDSLPGDSLKNQILRRKTDLIPDFTARIADGLSNDTLKEISEGQAALKINLVESVLHLWYNGKKDSIGASIHATFDLSALRPALNSSYMETVFLADETGSVFMWETDRADVRIHELAALDSLTVNGRTGISGIGISNIVQVPVAGQDYRFYLLPIRITLQKLPSKNQVTDEGPVTWILGGMVPVSGYRSQSFSIDPTMALWLGFLVIAGILVMPFVRIFTMGARERVRLGQLLYLVIALIFGTGFVGFYMADTVHYKKLEKDIQDQLSDTADRVAENLEEEICLIRDQLCRINRTLENVAQSTGNTPGDHTELVINVKSSEFDSVKMRDSLLPDKIIYPFFQMVFWTDSTGMQIAKWTPRAQNTSLIEVVNRPYFSAIMNDRAWELQSEVDPCAAVATCDCIARNPAPYYLESVRSWTTGENLAIISIPWKYRENDNIRSGISAITTELVSLTKPVLPLGVKLAVVDENARTLFHTRPERILDENFAEETGNSELFLSVISSRAPRDSLELTYGGQRKLMSLRPLPGRPLYLIVFKDTSLIDTVRFEAWFEGGVLFTIWVIMIMLLLFLLNSLSASRMAWIWPDLEKPGKYLMLILIQAVFIIIFLIHASTRGHPHIHIATILVPVIFLGLGLVVLSWSPSPNPRSRESNLGWLVFFATCFFLIVIMGIYESFQWIELLATILALMMIVVWLRKSNLRNYLDRWAEDFSPRMVYTTAMVGGLMVIGLLPGYLTYKFTYQDHSEHLVKYHQLDLAKSLKEQKNLHKEFLQANWDRLSRAQVGELLNKTGGYNYDKAYEYLIFETSINPDQQKTNNDDCKRDHDHSEDIHNTLHRLIGDHIPFLTYASVRMRQLSSEPEDWKWTRGDTVITLQMKSGEMTITSALPSSAGWMNSWRILLIFAFLAILFLIISRVSRWIFFIHIEHSEPLTLKDVLPKRGEDWKPMILVGNRSISRVPILSRGEEVHYIDLISCDKGQSDLKKFPAYPIPATAKAIIIDYADHRIEEEKWNRVILQFLEQHVYSGDKRPLILITSRDLYDLLFSVSTSNSQVGLYKNRWDRVLGRFTKVILSDDVPPILFEISMQLWLIRHLCSNLNDLAGKITGREAGVRHEPIKVYKRKASQEAAVKMHWLNDELNDLRKMLNPGKEGGASLPASVYPENLLRHETKESIELLNTLAGTLKDRPALSDDAGQIRDIVKELEVKSEKLKNKLEMIVAGTIDESESPADDQNDFAGVVKRIMKFVNRAFSVIGIWIIPTARRQAERKVHRQKENIHVLFRTMLLECGRHERLQEIGRQILSRPDWFELKESEVIDLVSEGAETYYAARWAILTHPERLVAAQLAKGAIINPKSPKALTRLYARRLIDRKPELRLDNESFAQYINDTVSPDRLLAWEREGIPSTWELIRGPLVIALIVIALFLFWSHRDFLGTTIAFLGTIGVGLGALLNLLSKLERGTGSGEVKGSNE